MDMENKDDILLREFFKSNRQEIADAGFSRRVMYRLPERKALMLNHLLSAVTAILAIVLFLAQDGVQVLKTVFSDFLANISRSGAFSAMSGVEPWTLVAGVMILIFMGYCQLLASVSE